MLPLCALRRRCCCRYCSGLHKPDDQTVLPPLEAAAFVAPLPVRALPGVGGLVVLP